MSVPIAPSNLTGQRPGNKYSRPYVLTWQNNGGTETGMRVYKEVQGPNGHPFQALPDLPAGTITYTDQQEPEHGYLYYVTAFNADGESLPSNTLGPIIGPAPSP